MKEKIFALTVLLAAALVSCGGGSSNTIVGGAGGADFVAVSIDSSAPYTYTETADASSPVSYDPYIWSSVSGTTSTHLYIHTYNGSSTSTPRMEIALKGTAPGIYNISDGNRMDYMPAGGPNYYCSLYFPLSSGTVAVTEFGPPGGGQIKGSFDVISTFGSMNTSTAHLTGSFTVTRN